MGRGVVAARQSHPAVRLTYVGRRHAFYLAWGDDARDEPAQDVPLGSVPASADLTLSSSSDAAQPYTYPEDHTRHGTGFTA